MKTPILRFLLSVVAVATVGLAGQAQAQIQHQIRSAKVSYEMQQTPDFSVSGPKSKRINPLDWLEVEVELDLETVNKSGYIDQLDAEFFIGVRDTNEGGKPTLLTGKISFVEVRAIEKKAWLSAYISPASLAKTTGKTKPGKADIEAVAVRITGAGLRAPITETVNGREGWFNDAALKRLDGLVLSKPKTPFAPLWTDRYPLTKEDR